MTNRLMNCDKLNCETKGEMVYCLDYPRYPFGKCPYYKSSIELNFQKEDRPLTDDIINKLRLDGL